MLIDDERNQLQSAEENECPHTSFWECNVIMGGDQAEIVTPLEPAVAAVSPCTPFCSHFRKQTCQGLCHLTITFKPACTYRVARAVGDAFTFAILCFTA